MITIRNYPYSVDLPSNGAAISVPNTPNLTYGTSSMSFAFWWIPDVQPRASTNVMIQTDSSSYASGVLLNQFGNDLYVYVKFGGPAYVATNYFVDARVGEPIRIGISISNVDYKVRVYKNGTLFGTSSATTPWNITSTNTCRIGASLDLSSTALGKFTDIVFMKGTVPTNQDFSDDYFLNKTLPNIVHRYGMTEGSGTTLADSVGGNTASLLGIAAWSTYTPMKTLATLPTSQNLVKDSNDLTKSTWTTDGTSAVSLVSGADHYGSTSNFSRLTCAGGGTFQYARGNGYIPANQIGMQYTMSAWVKTFAGGTQKMRFGIQAGGNLVSGDLTVTGTWSRIQFTGIGVNALNTFWVGNDAAGEALDVYISEVQIVRANNAGLETPTGSSQIDTGNIPNIIPLLQNLFTYSNTPANWVREGITAPVDITIVDPFGGRSACALTEDGTLAVHRLSNTAYTNADIGKTITVSEWFKAGTQNTVVFNVAGLASIVYNLSTGDWTILGAALYGHMNDRDLITGRLYEAGWYRCSATFVVTPAMVGFRNYWSVKQVAAYQGVNGDKALYCYEGQMVQANWEGDVCHTDASIVDNGCIPNIIPTSQNVISTSEPQVLSDLYAKTGVTVDSYVWPSVIGALYATAAGNNLVVRYAYQYFLVVDPSTTWTYSVFVKMDDNSVPVCADSSAASDLMLVYGTTAVAGTVTAVDGAPNVYRVSFIGKPTPGLFYYGFVKYITNSAKSFKVVGFQLECAPTVGPYKRTHGALYTYGNRFVNT